MAADFPTTVKTFTTKTNNVDTIDASHVNDLQDEVNAVETLLGAASKRRTSWTPAAGFAGGTPTFAYGANNNGLYVQLGSIVWFTARLDVGANSGGTGNLTASLPIAASGVSQMLCTITARGVSGCTLFPYAASIVSGATTCLFLSYTATAAGVLLQRGDVSTSAFEIRYTGFYWHG